MKTLFLIILFTGAIVYSQMQKNICVLKRPKMTSLNSNYVSNKAPLRNSSLIKLPLGSVHPSGWLKQQLDLMLNGTAGHLDEISYFLQEDNGWLKPEGIGWEEQPYWLRGFLPLAVLTLDSTALMKAEKWIEAVLRSQDDDGFFGPGNLRSIPGKQSQMLCDLWPHMLMIEVLIQYHEYKDDQRIVPFMTRFFDFCRRIPDEEFIHIEPLIDADKYPSSWKAWNQDVVWKSKIQYVRAGDMLPHIYWLYNRTGEEWLLELAERFYNKIKPPEGEWLDEHNVHFTQRYNYSAVHSLLSCDQKDIEQSEYWYTKHMATWGQQPRGIFGADERIRDSKTDPRQGFETCGMIEFAKSFYLIGQITGDPLYADRCEDIMLNHFPSAHTPDYRGLHYLTASNMPQLDAGHRHDFYNQKPQLCYSSHMYRCCQHNDAMGWTWYVQNLWQATADNGLAAWLYAPSVVNAIVGDNEKVSIESVTDYPFKTDVKLRIIEADAVPFPLYLRIPRWCIDFNLTLNNDPIKINTAKAHYVRLNRTWNSGDIVCISMKSGVTLTEWSSNNSVTVNRGPLSYTIKIDEKWRKLNRSEMSNDWEKSANFSAPQNIEIDTTIWPEWEVFPASPWNYGLLIDKQNPASSFEIHEKEKQNGNPWCIENAPIQLITNARRIPGWSLDESGTIEPLPQNPVSSNEADERITLIPMGCARLRVACIPVISR